MAGGPSAGIPCRGGIPGGWILLSAPAPSPGSTAPCASRPPAGYFADQWWAGAGGGVFQPLLERKPDTRQHPRGHHLFPSGRLTRTPPALPVQDSGLSLDEEILDALASPSDAPGPRRLLGLGRRDDGHGRALRREAASDAIYPRRSYVTAPIGRAKMVHMRGPERLQRPRSLFRVDAMRVQGKLLNAAGMRRPRPRLSPRCKNDDGGGTSHRRRLFFLLLLSQEMKGRAERFLGCSGGDGRQQAHDGGEGCHWNPVGFISSV